MNAEAATRFRLRMVTDAAHQALHHAAPFAAIAEGRASLAQYTGTLRTLHRYHAAMAQPCVAGAAALAMPEAAHAQTARLAALESDLASLGEAIPDRGPAPAPAEADFAVGVLYVVMGSALGGKVIHRQLDYLLPGADGRRFFAGAPDDGQVWRAFCRRLDSHDGAFERICDGAAWAFAAFGCAL
jgi:heme oxygenase